MSEITFDKDTKIGPWYEKSARAGLSKETIQLLASAGLDTREKIIDAGEVGWLRIPRFGKGRMDEVNEWLGDDAPPVARNIAKCVAFLEAKGYTVTPP